MFRRQCNERIIMKEIRLSSQGSDIAIIPFDTDDCEYRYDQGFVLGLSHKDRTNLEEGRPTGDNLAMVGYTSENPNNIPYNRMIARVGENYDPFLRELAKDKQLVRTLRTLATILESVH
jgi:hypothetical protein